MAKVSTCTAVDQLCCEDCASIIYHNFIEPKFYPDRQSFKISQDRSKFITNKCTSDNGNGKE